MKDSKPCLTCGEEKSLESFHKDKTRPDGRTTKCRSCRLKALHEYRAGKDMLSYSNADPLFHGYAVARHWPPEFTLIEEEIE